jgi:hypothetical protein
MGSNRISRNFSGRIAACSLLACVAAGAILLTAAVAFAQERSNNQEGAPKSTQTPAENPDFFGDIINWFDRQTSNIGSHLKGAGSQVENLGREAGIAAKTTVDGAKDVGDAVVKIPGVRLVRGHEKCQTAPNGAPDCLTAANAMCKSKGFESGKSTDMTTAEVCPARVYISGRNTGEGCHTETFVSRALCQ